MDFYRQLCDWIMDTAPAQTVPGKTYLLRAGETEKKLYFIREGAVQVVYETGTHSHVIRLAYPGSIVNALPSFLTGRPSAFSLQTIRKTVLHAVPAGALKTIFWLHRKVQTVTGNCWKALLYSSRNANSTCCVPTLPTVTAAF